MYETPNEIRDLKILGADAVGMSTVPVAIVAAFGVKMPKVSDRGLGNIGLSLIHQTGHLAPADKNLYAIRGITATVESIPLIASSIVSKKIASGNKNIALMLK